LQHFAVDTQSVGPNGKISLVKCFADLTQLNSTQLQSICRVSEFSEELLLSVVNLNQRRTWRLFHTLPQSVCGCVAATSCGYVSWPDYNF